MGLPCLGTLAVTCTDCQGEVNVSMHNGATLRCGCGKTMVPVAGSSMAEQAAVNRSVDGSSPSSPAISLPVLLRLMREHKALKVKAGGLEVELHPDAFAPVWSAQNSTLDATEKPCRCGHSIPVQHNPEGQCLEGCEPDACAEKAAA